MAYYIFKAITMIENITTDKAGASKFLMSYTVEYKYENVIYCGVPGPPYLS